MSQVTNRRKGISGREHHGQRSREQGEQGEETEAKVTGSRTPGSSASYQVSPHSPRHPQEVVHGTVTLCNMLSQEANVRMATGKSDTWTTDRAMSRGIVPEALPTPTRLYCGQTHLLWFCVTTRKRRPPLCSWAWLSCGDSRLFLNLLSVDARWNSLSDEVNWLLWPRDEEI